jgi:hypothetical protein
MISKYVDFLIRKHKPSYFYLPTKWLQPPVMGAESAESINISRENIPVNCASICETFAPKCDVHGVNK